MFLNNNAWNSRTIGVEGTLEADVKLKSSADNLFKLLTEEVHKVPDASSDNMHGVEVNERDWATTGSVKLWSYTSDGRKEEFKEKVDIDKEKRMMMLVAVGGDILEQYRVYKIVYHVAPEGDSARVKLRIVYEKFDENQGEPDNYLRFLVNVLKDTDAHLVGKQG